MNRRIASMAALRAILSGMLLLAPAARLHAAAPAPTLKVAQLMETSGLNHSVSQVLPGILASFDTAQPQIPLAPGMRAALRDAAAQGFQAAAMSEKIRARLADTLKEREIDDALAWLGTPLGKRITALENAASDPAEQARIQAYMAEMQKRPASPSRLGLIRELLRSTGAEEITGSIGEATTLAGALGLNASQPKQQQVPTELIQKQVKEFAPQVRKELGKLVEATYLYTYRSLSDREVGSYLKFTKSASGVAYHRSAMAGYRDALLEALGRFMTAIPKAIERTKGSVGA